MGVHSLGRAAWIRSRFNRHRAESCIIYTASSYAAPILKSNIFHTSSKADASHRLLRLHAAGTDVPGALLNTVGDDPLRSPLPTAFPKTT